MIQSRPEGLQQHLDARLADHAAVADQDHMSETEALLELLDLRCQGSGSATLPLEYLDRHRTTIAGAQQTENDLQLVAFAVAAVTMSCQRTAAAFEIG